MKRRKYSLFLCIAITILTSVIFLFGCTSGKKEKWMVGYAKINISPVIDGEIIPVPLGGYAEVRLADTIESDLYALCTAFSDSEGNKALIYAIDSIGINTDKANEMVKTISESVDVPEESIILNCTHNHASPAIDSTIAESKIYRDFLTEKLVEAAKNAIQDLSRCTKLYVGNLDIPDFSYIRRDDPTNVDPSVPVARFSRKDKKDILLINWAAHCDTVKGSNPTAVSSDYVGVLRDTLEKTGEMDVALQMGACGDVNPACFFEEHLYRGKEAYGQALAETISAQLANLKKVKAVGQVASIKRTLGAKVERGYSALFQKATEIRNAYYGDRMEEYERKCAQYGIENIYEATWIVRRSTAETYKEVTLRAVSVGGLVFASAPYEMFAHNGAEIKAQSPFDLTFVMGYSNGTEGYMPSDYAYTVGGYEVYSCWFEKGTAELLQDALSGMVAELSDPARCQHQFIAVNRDEDYHFLKCSLCSLKFTYPTKHVFDENYVCSICNEHIHKRAIMKGFSGLTMSCLGDSVTMGAKIEKSYVEIVGESLGLKAAYNYGVSWSTIGHKENCTCDHPYLPEDYNHDPMVYRYADMKKADIIFLRGGHNDFGMELPLGNIDDETPHTFYGALNLLISGTKQTFPKAYIFMATGLNYFDGYKNEDGVLWADYNDAIRKACQKQGIDCLELYDLPFNRLVDTVDYVHPTQAYTTNVLSPKIAEFIRQNYRRDYYYDGCVRCDEAEKIYYDNLFVDTVENHGKICTYDLQTKQFIEKDSKTASYTLINVEGMKEIRFAFTKERPSVDWSYFFYDKNDRCVGGANISSGRVDVYAEVPDDAVYVGVLYNPNAVYGVYQSA